MRHYVAIFLLAIATPILFAQNPVHTKMSGESEVPTEFFREWYHRSDLIYYLEAFSDHTIAETTTYGQWWIPERLAIAVEGLPSTANRYYIDGMRTDDRFQAGSSLYVPNMQQYNLCINTHTSQLYFSLDSTSRDYVQATYNTGQLGNGEPAWGTAAIFNIMHRSPMESADTYKHITARRHLTGAGTLDAAYTIKDTQGKGYRQHIYAAYGQRNITRENHQGLILDNPLYQADYYKVQADGQLPICTNSVFDYLGYRMNFSGREDGGSELLYNYNEVYDHKNYSGMLYARGKHLTTGLNWSTNTVLHSNQEFSKNILDQDGESFDPWIADGNTHELSWAVNYNQSLTDWLSVHVDAYNSMIHFKPKNQHFTNVVYMQSPIDEHAKDLYRYEWESNAYTGGLLENTFGLKAHYDMNEKLSLNAHLDITLDAILLRNKSKVNGNIQAGINLDLHPCKWFEMGVSLSHERMPYTVDQLRYFSDDYMNANVYYARTDELYATTGGKYHHYKKGLLQTSYLELDIPIHLHFGKHEIVLQQSYKKFFNAWHTNYLGAPEDYGYYQDYNGVGVFYLNGGIQEYEVGVAPVFGNNWLMNSPYYFSQLTRYTYTGRKVLVSVSWQSMQASGYCGLGNGFQTNNLGVLSETTANPNTSNVIDNQGSEHRGVGRYNLDKGYVCRFYLAYNICEWLQAGMTVKWTDGKPFTDYMYYANNNQVSILPKESRGTNPTDGNFGKRHCAKYNIDLHIQGKWQVRDIPMRLNIECYNMWDFCHDLAEMSFVQDIPYAHRASMIMDIPVGLLATYTIELP
ncbi:MAG: hypothetical protein IJX48_01240 [Paludibacteraceae bacterium]|nr:hypothetical protein [Paludibacteraceae bacterium]